MKADKLYLGSVITMDEIKPYAEAITVKDGLIQYVGSEDIARSLCDEATEVIDLRGKYIYPGFMEAHCHPLGAGAMLDRDFICDVGSGESLEEYCAILAKFIESHPGKKLYQGSGFVERDVKPTASMLDAVCSDAAIVISSTDGHSQWMNSKAMERYGIDRKAVEYYGADLVRTDENGNPTGYISENPVFDVRKKTVLELEDGIRFLENSQNFFFSKGYTAVYDAGLELIDKTALNFYAAATAAGRLKIRTYTGSLVDENCQDISAAVEAIDEKRKKYNNEYFKIIGVKSFSDGVVEAHTAYLLDDYCDQPGYKGVGRMVDHEKLVELYTKASELDMSVHVHTVGDRAIHVNLDAIEEAAAKTGKMDQRFALAHLQVVKPEDVQRFADLNVVAVTAPLWTPKHVDYFPQEVEYVGKERAEAAYPVKSFFAAGANTVYHTDFPVSRNVNIPETIYTAEKRRKPDQTDEWARESDEFVSRYQSLLAFTKNIAHMWHEEDRLGSLTAGKIANMSVFDSNFLTDDLDTVAASKLVCTVVDGEIVYQG